MQAFLKNCLKMFANYIIILYNEFGDENETYYL